MKFALQVYISSRLLLFKIYAVLTQIFQLQVLRHLVMESLSSTNLTVGSVGANLLKSAFVLLKRDDIFLPMRSARNPPSFIGPRTRSAYWLIDLD